LKFSELDLHPLVLRSVEESGFSECTPIQEAAIQPILSGRDVAGLAQTGTGKTAAFVLPLLDRVLRAKEALQKSSTEIDETLNGSQVAENVAPQEPSDQQETPQYHRYFLKWRHKSFVLILVPTRELAEQVHENLKKFGAFAGVKTAVVYGGTGYDGQAQAFREGVDFVVATPGRLIDLFKEHIVDLNQVQAIVFDEADRMFDMGFKDDMRYILRRVPRDRQFLVFSATLNFDVLQVAYEFGSDPLEVNVSRDQAKAENVEDELFHVGHYDKPQYLLSVIKKHQAKQTIIFSNFKHNVEKIARFLSDNGFPAMGISSLLSQGQRNRVMELFRSQNDQNILVATDVAARGLDVKGLDLVINYELPDDAENYVHRIGRTGRAGATGKAISLVSDRDVEALSRIESYLGHKVKIGWIEDSELVTNFKPFPREERFSKGPYKGGRPKDRPRSTDSRRPDSNQRKEHPRSDQRFEKKPSTQAHQKSAGHSRPQHGRHGEQGQQNRQGPNRSQKHDHKKQFEQKRIGHRAANRPYTHRPQEAYTVKPKTLGEKITGFFKRLIG
jgi:ATP-dependent RNA helicase RhlB